MSKEVLRCNESNFQPISGKYFFKNVFGSLRSRGHEKLHDTKKIILSSY